ncbi:MAG TPA: bacteriohemerythrin [Aurantimonas coralicida]|uniref:Bacteriohemerythrin n=2 Tax=root TaxID=1 RepID=A0A9C9NG55_9HYPH|nr:bacteriohemerythrin [Aurantimonas coralicida]HEU00715.1 bacteriohemerythrin [Aurantimonas coralicida]
MPRMEWKDSYNVGVPAVDHEHKELIDLVNRLGDALIGDGDAVAAFGDLFRGISAHFALEEKFMREHDYDQIAQHKADHERLLDELRDIMSDYEAGDGDQGGRLIAALDPWFTEHFKTHDARLHSRLGQHPH